MKKAGRIPLKVREILRNSIYLNWANLDLLNANVREYLFGHPSVDVSRSGFFVTCDGLIKLADIIEIIAQLAIFNKE
ncbi:MAG TPA: hypothetical protein VJ044_16000 [Candidatus Hodarchaeales archaeon]|nr:hypothetical protein [Candidatus Hodarchaeales archaeon]